MELPPGRGKAGDPGEGPPPGAPCWGALAVLTFCRKRLATPPTRAGLGLAAPAGAGAPADGDPAAAAGAGEEKCDKGTEPASPVAPVRSGTPGGRPAPEGGPRKEPPPGLGPSFERKPRRRGSKSVITEITLEMVLYWNICRPNQFSGNAGRSEINVARLRKSAISVF